MNSTTSENPSTATPAGGPEESIEIEANDTPPADPSTNLPLFAPDLDTESAIFQALGAASMCWVGGTGDLEFDSRRAEWIGNELITHLRQLRLLPDPDADR